MKIIIGQQKVKTKSEYYITSLHHVHVGHINVSTLIVSTVRNINILSQYEYFFFAILNADNCD